MFNKILIANRGEIACRVAATARKLGVRTVAVYSDADASARHVALCDEAVRLGPPPARESYLRGDLIIAAARATDAQAIHPGYGFLSENKDFAQSCTDAGVVFIGPPAKAIFAMGSKSEAKALMARAGVPLVPGYHGADQDPALLKREADRIGYPMLIKASSGGGGKGMRIVRGAGEFAAALESCTREAVASFGDARVLLEKYLDRPRHIEIQVFADSHGHCVYLFERDCSVQRRHQKVIEEAPAPGMSAEGRHAMGKAAVAAAQAVGYVGAGTVEFIAETVGAARGTFYFMEMNTRLQVEHPVTEMIVGHDLVAWQLHVASGEPLPVTQEDLQIRGHALEARIYAENPDRGFLPAIGTLHYMAQPDAVEFSGQTIVPPAPVRIDAGVRAGDAISAHYDPMIAKLITWGEDRAQALARMRAALADVHIVGVANNVDFLGRLMDNASFAAADLDTGLIERERAQLFPPAPPLALEWLALACARVRLDDDAAANSDPWSHAHGWRLNMSYERKLEFTCGGESLTVWLDYGRTGLALRRAAAEGERVPFAITEARGTRITVRAGERTCTADVVHGSGRAQDELHLFLDGRHRLLTLRDPIAHAGESAAADGSLAAPMPGKVIAVLASAGARVARGAALLVMEAMKMEHTIVAPADGTVDEILYGVGEQVDEGAALARFTRA